MKIRAYLLRHGECYGNLDKIKELEGGPKRSFLPGYKDTSLTDRGKIQTYAAGEYINELSGGQIDGVVSSKLIRARETAWSLSLALSLVTDGIPQDIRLNEIEKCPILNLAKIIKDDLRSKLDPEGYEMPCVHTFSDGKELEFLSAPAREALVKIRASYALFKTWLFGDDYADAYIDHFENQVMIAFRLFVGKHPGILEGNLPRENADLREYRAAILSWLKSQRTSGALSGFSWRLRLSFASPRTMDPGMIYLDCGDSWLLGFSRDHKECTLSCIRDGGRMEEFAIEMGYFHSHGGKNIVFVTHAKRLIRQRRYFENLGQNVFDELNRAQDLAFPQNASVTVYDYDNQNETYTLIGEPYQIPDKLIYAGKRRVGFQMLGTEFGDICSKLKLDPNKVYDPMLDKLS